MKSLEGIALLALVIPPAALACRATSHSLAGAAPIALTTRCDGDLELSRSLELLGPHMTSAGSPRTAEFELRNASTSELHVYYSIEWFDSRIARIEVSPQLWFPVDLDPGDRQHIRASAPDPRAESFRLIAQRPEALVH
ncbi:MAG: DUF1425 domain-containing protein [Thermoanaerobaculia bacterium]